MSMRRPPDRDRRRRRAARRRSGASAETAWSANEQAERHLRSVGQAIHHAVLGYAHRRRHDGRTARARRRRPELLSEKLANGGSLPQSSGTAWAAITAPGVASIWDQTAVEARVDPGSEQSNARHLLEQIGAAQRAIFADPEERLQPDPAGHRAGARHRQPSGAQLRDRPVGKSSASPIPAPASSPGQTLSTSDDKWLRKVGAEQKLFDGVTISGSIGETPSGAASKSLSAGFRRSW